MEKRWAREATDPMTEQIRVLLRALNFPISPAAQTAAYPPGTERLVR